VDTERKPGVYGKLPMYGDFIHRNLPSAFITPWDEWLQLYIAGSSELIGDGWLDIYLTSPVWHFVFSPGVIDANSWAGIVMPSVDQVGRNYPFSVVLPLPSISNPLEFIALQHASWFDSVEALARQALEEQCQVDELVDALSRIENNFTISHVKTGKTMQSNIVQINMTEEERRPVSVYAHLLESILSKSMKSYSLWTTHGSERIAPCLFCVQGLPLVNNIPAMLDGQWSHWGWPQTYMVK